MSAGRSEHPRAERRKHRTEDPRATLENVTFDCADAAPLARFWAAALGYDPPRDATAEWALLVPPAETGPRLLFLKVPEPKTVKNRVHLDLTGPDHEAEADRLVALGARRLRFVDKGDERWWIMADPEGNEFCLAG